MTVQITAAGAQARSIMRRAWSDPEHLAVAALEQVNELAAAATDPQALAEIQDAGTMLQRLVGTLGAVSSAMPATMTAHLARPMTITESLELAAIHGHHIKGTQYTFRHGWIPVIGKQLVDKYPSWLGEQIEASKQQQKELEKAQKALERHKMAEAKLAPDLNRRLRPAPPVAAERKMDAEQRQIVSKQVAQQARVARALARSQRASTPPAAHSAAPATVRGVRMQSVRAYEIEPKSQTTHIATPAEKLGGDEALAKLAEPGASMAMLKSYIDARVAAEVARQVGQITAKQESDLKSKLASMHLSQQKLISFIRKQTKEGSKEAERTDRIQLSMYTLFNAGSVAAALGGIAAGLSPIGAALVAGIVPMINVIHDYVRSSG